MGGHSHLMFSRLAFLLSLLNAFVCINQQQTFSFFIFKFFFLEQFCNDLAEARGGETESRRLLFKSLRIS